MKFETSAFRPTATAADPERLFASYIGVVEVLSSSTIHVVKDFQKRSSLLVTLKANSVEISNWYYNR
jgi:hypothetical protein